MSSADVTGAGFRQYWRWKSRPHGGRPQIDADLRALIRRMSVDNPLWGAPRIHGELLKLGFEVAQSSARTALHLKKKWAQCGRSSREFRRAPPQRGKVGCDRSRAQKAEGPMTDCRVAAEHRSLRPTPTRACAARARSPSTRSRMHPRGLRSFCG